MLSKINQFEKNTYKIGALTVLSRILGSIRELIILQWLGTSKITDALIIATRIPTFIRKATSEGALNNSLIPTLKDTGPAMHETLINNVVLFFSIFFMGFYLVQDNFQKQLLCVLSPGILNDFEKMIYFEKFIKFTSFSILLFFINSVFSSILNYHQKFFAPAFAPCVWNIILIALFGVSYIQGYSYQVIGPIYVIATIGLALTSLIPALRILKLQKNTICLLAVFLGLMFFNKWTFLIGALVFSIVFLSKQGKDDLEIFSKFSMLLIPIIFINGISQIKSIILLSTSSLLETGSITLMHRADKILQIPFTIIFPLTVTLLPELTKTNSTYTRRISLLGAFLISIPISLFLLFFPRLLVKLMFGLANMTHADYTIMSSILRIYAFAIPAYLCSKILPLFFFANKKVRIPTIATFFEAATQILLNFATIYYGLGVAGLAMAFVISLWVEVLILLVAAKHQKYI
jgi:putative peptidoglycan lipid II flippase